MLVKEAPCLNEFLSNENSILSFFMHLIKLFLREEQVRTRMCIFNSIYLIAVRYTNQAQISAKT